MERTTYICDKCGKEFMSHDELESYWYWPLRIEQCYKRISSFGHISGEIKVDLCEECNALFRKRIDDFITELREEFNSQ